MLKGIITFILCVVGVIIIFALVFGGEMLSLKWQKFFAPKHEAVRREVFKETRSYNEAKLQQLSKYRLEYLRSTSETEKAALASTIRHTFAEYDESKLPHELKKFLYDIKY